MTQRQQQQTKVYGAGLALNGYVVFPVLGQGNANELAIQRVLTTVRYATPNPDALLQSVGFAIYSVQNHKGYLNANDSFLEDATSRPYLITSGTMEVSRQFYDANIPPGPGQSRTELVADVNPNLPWSFPITNDLIVVVSLVITAGPGFAILPADAMVRITYDDGRGQA